jgi:hypothetical protein
MHLGGTFIPGQVLVPPSEQQDQRFVE